MLKLVGRRLVALVPILLIVSFGVFCLSLFLPGDPAVQLAGGESATPERIAEVREELNLDDPFLTRYLDWLGGAVRFDFGHSFLDSNAGGDVATQVRERLPVTLSLTSAALVVALLVGVPAGIVGGLTPGRAPDKLTRFAATLGLSIPHFWFALLLILAFSIQRAWLPALGFVPFAESPLEWARHMVLPALTLGVSVGAVMARQLRAALIDVMSSNYVRTAWAKGGRARLVVGKHALKNAAIPAVTVLGLQLGTLLGGSVVVEEIFALPGLGTYMIRAILNGDFPVVQAVTVVFVLVHVVMNLLVDVSYGFFNPKVRVG